MTLEDAIERVEDLSNSTADALMPDDRRALRLVIGRAKECARVLDEYEIMEQGYEAELALVRRETAKEPRVYALGEDERRTLEKMLRKHRGTLHLAAGGPFEPSKQAEVDALAAALALQEPFTVRDYESFLYFAELRAYIEGRKAQTE